MPMFKASGIKANSPSDGFVEGYASTFDREPDSYGDVVAKGAFARTLKEWGENEHPIPLLYGHSTDDPMKNIGQVLEAYEDERGLFVKAEFDADNPTAQYVRKLVQEGRLYQFSFAYAVRSQGVVELENGTQANELRDLDLFEVSLVQIPANQHAVVTGVKSGRRNSRKDADTMRDVRGWAANIIDAIDGLLTDEDDAPATDGGPELEANAEEPDTANAEEPTAKDTSELDSAIEYAKAILAATETMEV